MAALIAAAFGPIFAYALALIDVGDGKYSQGWRWIYVSIPIRIIIIFQQGTQSAHMETHPFQIIEGIVTIVVGMIAPFFLIEFPERVKFLTPRQKHIALERVRLDRAAGERVVVHLTIKQTLTSLLDIKIVLYSINYFIVASSGYSLAFFSPIILREGLGFSYIKAQLLSSPPYVFTIIASLASAWISDKQRLRWPILNIQSLAAIVGLLIMLYTTPPGVRYFGLFLATYGTQSNAPATLTYGQNQTAKLEKKGVVAAAMISAGALGGVCGSTIFRKQDAPDYLPGMWATIAMQLLHLILTFAMSWHFKRQNARADRGEVVLEGVEGFRYAP